MTSPLDLYREDLEKQKTGSPCYVGDMTFYLKRGGTPEAKRELAEIRERLYGLQPNPKEIDEWRIWAHWLAEYGLTDWDILEETDDGEQRPLDFTKASARDIFLNEEYRNSLVPILAHHCLNYENYLFDQANEDAETVKKPSTSTEKISPPKKKRKSSSATSTQRKQSKKSGE